MALYIETMVREPALLGWKSFVLLLCLAVGLGAMYRFADLGKRPMHTDEAILALKTQEMWRTGFFKYDPKDYHGPFLHHATKTLAWLRGWTVEDLDEHRLRWVAGVFGMGMILLPLLFLDALGRTGVALAALLIAVSPMMTFYSRYYIMEAPFVFLTGLMLAALWRWTQRRRVRWVVLAGLCAGCLHATKETFVINVAAMMLAGALVWLAGGSFVERDRRLSFAATERGRTRGWAALWWFGGAAVCASVWQFSNGLEDWTGVRDSVLTYGNYLQRSEGSGHEKPWWYYLRLLFWWKDGFLWTEALIGGLALAGMLSLAGDAKLESPRRAALGFLTVYAVGALVMYSAIPYKTPWTVMSVDFAFALLAGFGVRWLFSAVRIGLLRVLMVMGLTAGGYHLCRQTNLATDFKHRGQVRYSADARNPYVYSHTSANLLKLVKAVEELAAMTGEGNAMPVQVVQVEHGWPLPWYWRRMTQVGYQADFPANLDARVVVVDWDRETEALQRLRNLAEGPSAPYVASVFGLRPGMNVVMLVREDLWEKWRSMKGGKG